MDELITTKKQFSKLGWFYVAATFIILTVQTVMSVLLNLFCPKILQNMNVNILLGMIPMYLAGFPFLALMLKKYVPAKKPERHKMTAGQYVLSVIICLGLAYAANIVGNIVTTVIGILAGKPVENEMLSIVDSLSPAVIFIYMVVCAPIVEEYVFRKLIVDRTVRYGQSVAVVFSGLMFGLFHGNLNQFAYATVIGMFLAYLYVKTGNLKITISLHMLFNFIGGFLSSFLIKAIDLEGYLEAAASGDMQVLMEQIMSNLGGWLLYGLFAMFVIGMLIAGIVLFIVFVAKRKFTFDGGEVTIPRELKFSIAFGNLGMLVFIAVWLVRIVLQLFV